MVTESEHSENLTDESHFSPSDKCKAADGFVEALSINIPRNLHLSIMPIRFVDVLVTTVYNPFMIFSLAL